MKSMANLRNIFIIEISRSALISEQLLVILFKC